MNNSIAFLLNMGAVVDPDHDLNGSISRSSHHRWGRGHILYRVPVLIQGVDDAVGRISPPGFVHAGDWGANAEGVWG